MKQETAVATEIEPETVSNSNFRPAPERKRNRGLSEDKRFKIFAGSGNRQLAEEICRQMGVPLGETKMQRFADGEIYFQLLENVRGADVFVVQPTCNPVDSNLVELLIMIDALKRASAGRITAVVPYYGYARQDRKDRPRVAISSKLVADLLTTAGANRHMPDHRRYRGHCGHVGEDRACTARRGRDGGVCVRIASGALRASGGAHCHVAHQGACGYEFHSTVRGGTNGGQDQGAIRRRSFWNRN
jgi:hypothetical protein